MGRYRSPFFVSDGFGIFMILSSKIKKLEPNLNWIFPCGDCMIVTSEEARILKVNSGKMGESSEYNT